MRKNKDECTSLFKKVKELEVSFYEQEKVIYRIQVAMKKLCSPVLEQLKSYEVVYETPDLIYIFLIWISCGILVQRFLINYT